MNAISVAIAENLARLRREQPLVHHITNLVVIHDTANITLHAGALPIMADAAGEVAEVTRQARALVLNLGTPNPARTEAMLLAGHEANRLDIPIVLDPVGAGATRLRSELSSQLLDTLRIAVVRGNAGEIAALAGRGGAVKGVDSVAGDDGGASVQIVARARRTVAAMTGPRDIVSDGRRVLGVDNGHPWLQTITGTGCMATALIAAFAAAADDYVVAAVGGLACLGLAAELAACHAAGPATFQVALFDQLYHLSPERLAAGARVVELAKH